MTSLFTSFSMDRLAQLAWTQTWQLAALAAVVFIVTRLACRRHPHVAYLLWMLVVLKALVPPVWSSPSGAFSWALAETQTTPATIAQPLDPTPGETIALTAASPVANQPISLVPAVDAVKASLAWQEITMIAVAAIWALGVFAISTLTAVRWWRLKQLLARSPASVDPEVARTFDELARRIVPRRQVRLLLTSAPIGPAAFGWWRGTVVVPSAIVAGKSSEELAPILAHELIHLRRYDTLAGSLQLLAQCLWWFHPAVWVANRQARLERERACDEAVVAELACSPAGYARLLVQILEWRQQLAVPLAWPSMRGIDITTQRLQSMLAPARSFRRRAPAWSWMILLAAAALVLPGAGLQRTITAEPATGDLQTAEVTGTYSSEEPAYTYFALAEQPEVPAELKPLLAEFEKQGLKLYPNLRKGKLELTGLFTKGFRPLEQPFELEKLPQLTHVDLATYEDKSAEQVADKLKALRNLGGQTTLSIMSQPAFGSAINELANIPGLRKLMLHGSFPPLAAAGKAGRTLSLNGLPKLETLVLSETNDATLAELTGLKALTQLNVFGTVTEKGLANLAELTALTDLMVAGSSQPNERTITPADLPWIERLTELKFFYIGGSFGLSDAGAARLAKLNKLDKLQIDEALTDAGLASLAELKQLRSLMLQFTSNKTRLTPAGFASLSKLTNLRQFYLYRQQEVSPPLVTDDVLNAWNTWADLRVLTLTNCRLTDASAPAIRSWKKLQALDVFGDIQLTDAGVTGWSTSLRRLQLPIPKLTNQGVAAFGQLNSLRTLSLNDAVQITDAALPALTGLKKLDSLSLQGAKLTGPKATSLAQLPALQQLTLSSCQLSDAAIQSLATVKTLRALNLSNMKLGNERLKLLAELTQLHDLTLNDNPINDEGLSVFAGLKNLQQLRLAGTETTPAGRQKLAQANPKLNVDDGSNGWLSMMETDALDDE